MKQFCLFFAAMVVCVSTSFTQTENDFTVIQNKQGKVTITGYTGTQRDVVIPAKISGMDVSEIRDFSFKDKRITSVTIPNTVTEIGGNAFEANQLTVLDIPHGVEIIHADAFSTNHISSLTLPNSLLHIHRGAFGFNQLSSITIGNNIKLSTAIGDTIYNNFVNFYGVQKKAGTYIRKGQVWFFQERAGFPSAETEAELAEREKIDEMFSYIQNKTGKITITGYTGTAREIVIPQKISGVDITEVGELVFWNKNLISVTLPAGLTTIGWRAFRNNYLTAITIPDTVTFIGVEAFMENRLVSVTLPAGITVIEGFTFHKNLLAGITIPDNVIRIETDSFSNNRLSNITIPSTVISIRTRAFFNNPLTSLTVGSKVYIDNKAFGDESFNNFYNSQGKKSGTYIKNGPIWTLK
jgi:hypothetical protein